MPKALIISDLHLEWCNKFVIEKLYGVEFLILAGDIGSFKSHLPFIKDCAKKYKVLYVLGNHEFYGHTLKEVRDFWASVELENFYFLDNSSVVIDGFEFIGSTLWTSFDNDNFHVKVKAPNDISDFSKILNQDNTDYISVDEILEEHKVSYAYLKEALYNDNGFKKILITHHGISYQSVHPKFLQHDSLLYQNHFYTNNMDYMIGYSGAILAIHGHMHTTADYMLGDVTRVICNPLGMPDSLNESFMYKVVDLENNTL
jgi:predicted phosphodiesterase